MTVGATCKSHAQTKLVLSAWRTELVPVRLRFTGVFLGGRMLNIPIEAPKRKVPAIPVTLMKTPHLSTSTRSFVALGNFKWPLLSLALFQETCDTQASNRVASVHAPNPP